MGEAAPKDNSMEEILASIRRIIGNNNDTDGAAKPGTPAASAGKGSGRAETGTAMRAAVETGNGSTSGDGEPSPGSLAAIANAVRDGASAPQTVPGNARLATAKPVSAATSANADAPRVATETSTPGSLAELASQMRGAPQQPAASKAETHAAAGSFADLARSVREGAASGPATSGAAVSEPAKTVQAEPLIEAAPQEQEAVGSVSGETPEPPVEPSHPVAAQAVAEDAGEAPAVMNSASAPGDDAADEAEAFREALASPATISAVNASMDRLRKAVMDQQAARAEAIMRPMIKEWLDENLPAMVERMVQAEIERIAADLNDPPLEEAETASGRKSRKG